MHDFLIKKIVNSDIEKELMNIGFDKSYTHIAKNKFDYINIKIFDLNCAQANIIKQTALSVGADCGTHRDVITGKIENSSCILGGSVAQLLKITQKLKMQPFNLKDLGTQIENILDNNIKINRTQIIGVLNITQNSFSDGGEYYKFEDAIKHLNELVEDGADIIDIGAESTKPFSKPVDTETQLKKLEPILQYIKEKNIKTPISIDTRDSIVAQKCIELGANIINDVSGFDYDRQMVKVLAQNPQIKIILQHSQGTPETMQIAPSYENLMDEISSNLQNKIEYAISKGIKKENIIIDPGIGFGKTKQHNLEILNRWQELKTTRCPVLIGLSRKSLLELPEADNKEKDMYSLALATPLLKDNIDYIRVHNVKIHKKLQSILSKNQ